MKPLVLKRLQLTLTWALPQGDAIVRGRTASLGVTYGGGCFQGAKLGSKIKQPGEQENNTKQKGLSDRQAKKLKESQAFLQVPKTQQKT